MRNGNYQSPAVVIRFFSAEEIFTTASVNGTEGLYRDKWSDMDQGQFY